MELTGLQIFKFLPAAKKAEGTNCKQCGCPTCMAFALKLAKKQADIEKCPYIPDELKEKFCEASKIQQHEIDLGFGVKTGGETVMFRHDKTFVNKTVIALELDCDAKDFFDKLEKIKNFEIERIGEKFRVDALYLKGKPSEKQEKNLESLEIPIIKEDDERLICAENFEQLEELSSKSSQKEKILSLEFGKKTIAQIMNELTFIRRAAILKRYEPFTWPVMVKLPDSLNVFETCAAASFLICRYANIIVLKEFNEALLATIFTLRQNIYTNPQKPLQVEAKVYEFNEPSKDSPVFLTTNFALTYFAVAGELESLPFGSYLVVTPADGMSVLTAWSADKFTSDMVAKSVKNFDLMNKVDTRAIIIPGLLSHMKDELQEAMPEWEIVVGTVEACQIPEFIKNRK